MSDNKVPDDTLASLAGERVNTAKSPWAAGFNYSVYGQRGEVVYNTFTRRLALVAPNGGQIDVMGTRYAREVAAAVEANDDDGVFALLAGHYGRELAGGAR